MTAVVGRDERIEGARRAIEGGGSVAVFGPAGMGKTTFARTVAEASGRTVLWCTVTRSAATIALGPIAPLLAEAGVADLMTQQVLVSLGAALRRARPDALVVIDDAHLLDDASAAVIHRLASDGIPVVVTARSEEPAPDAVTALWSDPIAERVDLGPLDVAGVHAQVGTMLGGEVATETIQRIHDLSNGNPLYVREIVLAGTADGWLQFEAGRWRAAGGPPPSGARLRELIAARLLDCTPAQVEALELVAVAEEIDLAALRRIVGVDVILALEDRQLLRVTDRPDAATVAIDHQIIAEVVRAELGGVRRQLHADRLVDALAETSGPSTDRLLRMGALSLQASAPDPDVLLEAAAAAQAVHDFRAANRFARAAAAHGGGVDAELAWASAAAAARAYAEAEEVIRRIEATPGLTSGQRASAATTLATVLMWGLGRAAEAQAALEQAAVDDAERTRLDAELAFLLLNLGQVDRAIAVCGPALLDPSPAVRLRAAATSAAAHALKGMPDTVDEIVRAYLDDAATHALVAPRALAELIASQVMVRHLSGTPVEMADEARGVIDMADGNDPELEGVGRLLLGLALLARGHAGPAAEAVDRALELFVDHDTAQLTGWAHAVRAHVAGHLCDLDAVEDHLQRSSASPHHAFTSYDFDRAIARCRATVCQGDRRAAIDRALDTADHMRSDGRDAAEAILLDLAGRLGHRGTSERLSELAARAEGPLVPAIAAHATAADAADPDALLAVADRLEEIGDDLAAADAAAEAARCAWDADRRTTAAAAANRASTLVARCGGASLARPLPSPGLTLDLTERELEIAVLAARGQSNKEIAAHLYLSARTVGNHLYRTYAKTGVEGRAELADVLRAAGHLR